MLLIIENTNGHQKYGSITVLINKETYQPYYSVKSAIK